MIRSHSLVASRCGPSELCSGSINRSPVEPHRRVNLVFPLFGHEPESLAAAGRGGSREAESVAAFGCVWAGLVEEIYGDQKVEFCVLLALSRPQGQDLVDLA